jgi:predicted Zn-dependent protease
MRQKHLATIMCACLIVACQTVEQTGRSQFIIASVSQELQLGDQAYQETLKKNRLSTRSDWQTQLRRVGERIAAAANKPEYKWEFTVSYSLGAELKNPKPIELAKP